MNPETPASPPPPSRPFWGWLTIVVFFGLLWLPTLDYFFRLDHARPPNENRLLAKAPQFQGLKQTQDFLGSVEKYFNDHFGFRKRLIRWNHHWKQQLFHDPNSREVIVGREGWMFYSAERMLEHCTREAAWTPQELENWRRLLEARRDWLRERGAKYLFVVPPDKHTVYPEYLPEWLVPGTKPTKVQQLIAYLKTNSTVEMLDLSQVLIEAKKARVDYLKTDTHWNQFGGFTAYRAVTEALARQMPGLQSLPLEWYDWKPVTGPAGDLAGLMGRADSCVETQQMRAVPLKSLPNPNLLYDPVRLPQKGAKETWTCYTLNEKATGKAMVFRDSFSCSWYPFLGQHFKEVIYVWHYEWDRALLEQEKPDVVIDEILERFFNQQDPVSLACKDQLSATNTTRLQAGR